MATIKKLNNGKWELRYDTTDPVSGTRKQHKRLFDRQKDAAAHLKHIEDQGRVAAKDYALRDWLRNWLDAKSMEIKATSYSGYKNNIENHIIPELGNVKLSLLTPVQVDELYSKLASEKNLSHNSIKYVHRVLYSALQKAAGLRIIPYNPAQYVELPKIKKTFQPVILNAAGVKQLLGALKDSEVYIPVLLAVSLGMRRGEVLGLRWEDISFRKKIIHLHTNRTTAGGETVETTLKSDRRVSDILCPDFVMEALRTHRKAQMEHKLDLGDAYVDSQYVCTWANGEPYQPGSFSNVFKNALKAAGLPHMRFHDLRHTHVTLLREAGVDREYVMQRVGHNTEAMTEHYTHLSDQQQLVVVTEITKLLT